MMEEVYILTVSHLIQYCPASKVRYTRITGQVTVANYICSLPVRVPEAGVRQDNLEDVFSYTIMLSFVHPANVARL